MTDESKDIDEHSGVETTGHSWDGIKELNNPLPRWWLYVWYMSIAWAIVYMILMPAIPALPGLGTNTKGLRGHSDRVEVAKAYPALADDVWLWDGSLDGIEYTIRHGIRHDTDDGTRFSAMPAFGRDGLLKRSEVDDLAQYVLDLSGHSDDPEAVLRAAPIFQQQCATCHGADGTGDRTQGAPNLTDAEWLYGDREADIEATIYNARNSHMPAWDDRLDDATIKAIAVYVHSLGGGE